MTNDVWSVVINIDLGSYENVSAIVTVDFFLVQKQKSEFTSVSELEQVEILLT